MVVRSIADCFGGSSDCTNSPTRLTKFGEPANFLISCTIALPTTAASAKRQTFAHLLCGRDTEPDCNRQIADGAPSKELAFPLPPTGESFRE